MLGPTRVLRSQGSQQGQCFPLLVYVIAGAGEIDGKLCSIIHVSLYSRLCSLNEYNVTRPP